MHHVFGIPRAGGDAHRRGFSDLFQIIGGQFNVCRRDVFFEIFPTFGAGDGNNVVALGQHLREREL